MKPVVGTSGQTPPPQTVVAGCHAPRVSKWSGIDDPASTRVIRNDLPGNLAILTKPAASRRCAESAAAQRERPTRAAMRREICTVGECRIETSIQSATQKCIPLPAGSATAAFSNQSMRTGRGTLGLMRMRGKWCDWQGDIGGSLRDRLLSCLIPMRWRWSVATSPGSRVLRGGQFARSNRPNSPKELIHGRN
jgi:hypothetical protein